MKGFNQGALPEEKFEEFGRDREESVDALLEKKTVEGENLVIIGGGLTGIEIAYDQAKHGRKVNVVEMLPEILAKKEDLCAANENMLKAAIEYYKIAGAGF